MMHQRPIARKTFLWSVAGVGVPAILRKVFMIGSSSTAMMVY